jgi:hypothetical protein
VIRRILDSPHPPPPPPPAWHPSSDASRSSPQP